jgi:hypothetical protein
MQTGGREWKAWELALVPARPPETVHEPREKRLRAGTRAALIDRDALQRLLDMPPASYPCRLTASPARRTLAHRDDSKTGRRTEANFLCREPSSFEITDWFYDAKKTTPHDARGAWNHS